MNELDNNILSENRLPGSERFTRPEEIQVLSKFLKKVHNIQDEHTKLGEDNLALYGKDTGILKEINSLPDIETLDHIKGINEVSLPTGVEKILDNEHETKISLLKEKLLIFEDENAVDLKKLNDDSVKLVKNENESEIKLVSKNDQLLDVSPITDLANNLIRIKVPTTDSLEDTKLTLNNVDKDNILSDNLEKLDIGDKVKFLSLHQKREDLNVDDRVSLETNKENLIDDRDIELSHEIDKLKSTNNSIDLEKHKEKLRDDRYVELSKTRIDIDIPIVESLSDKTIELEVKNKVTSLQKDSIKLLVEDDPELSNKVEKLDVDNTASLSHLIEKLNVDQNIELPDSIETISPTEIEELSTEVDYLVDTSEPIEKLPEDNFIQLQIDKVIKLSDKKEILKVKNKVDELSSYKKSLDGEFKKTKLVEDNEKLLKNTNKLSEDISLEDQREQLAEGSFKRLQELPKEFDPLEVDEDISLTKYREDLNRSKPEVELVNGAVKLTSGDFKPTDKLSDNKSYLIVDEKVSLLEDSIDTLKNFDEKVSGLSDYKSELYVEDSIDTLSAYKKELNIDEKVSKLEDKIFLIDNDFRDDPTLEDTRLDLVDNRENQLEDFRDDIYVDDVKNLEDTILDLNSNTNTSDRIELLDKHLKDSKSLNDFSPTIELTEDLNRDKLRTILTNILEKEGTKDLNEEELFNRVIKLLQSFNTYVDENGKEYIMKSDYSAWSSKLESIVTAYFKSAPNQLLNTEDYESKLLSTIEVVDKNTLDRIREKFESDHPNASLGLIDKNNFDYKDYIDQLINTKSKEDLKILLGKLGSSISIDHEDLNKNQVNIELYKTIVELAKLVEASDKNEIDLYIEEIMKCDSIKDLSDYVEGVIKLKDNIKLELIDYSIIRPDSVNELKSRKDLSEAYDYNIELIEDNKSERKEDIIYNRIINDRNINDLQDQLNKLSTKDDPAEQLRLISSPDMAVSTFSSKGIKSIPSYTLPKMDISNNLKSIIRKPTVSNIVSSLGIASQINISNYIRFAAEELINNQLGKEIVSNGTIRKRLLEETLAFLVFTRDQLEIKNKTNRGRLPGIDIGHRAGADSFKKQLKNSLKASITGGTSGNSGVSRNRPRVNPDGTPALLEWEKNGRVAPTEERENNFFRYNFSSIDGTLCEDFRSKYVKNVGVLKTLFDLTNWDGVEAPGSLDELKKLIKESPFTSNPMKFGSVDGRYQVTSLATNSHWEITLEPFLHNQMNGGFSYLPSFREINTVNLRVNGANTGYNEWLPIINFELGKSRMLNKTLQLYEGEIAFPSGVEFTNELSITIVNDSYKSWSYYWRRVMEATVYNSEPHKKDYYQELYPIPTSVDKSVNVVSLYKNITWLCKIYVLTPQYSTIKSFNLLVVLKDFEESYLGETESGGAPDINLKFSIVGENPPPEEPLPAIETPTTKPEKPTEIEKIEVTDEELHNSEEEEEDETSTNNTTSSDNVNPDEDSNVPADTPKPAPPEKKKEEPSKVETSNESGKKTQKSNKTNSSGNMKVTTTKAPDLGKGEWYYKYDPNYGYIHKVPGDPTKDPYAIVFQWNGSSDSLKHCQTRNGIKVNSSNTCGDHGYYSMLTEALEHRRTYNSEYKNLRLDMTYH